MRIGARMKAAEEVLREIFDHHRPASQALADWGRSHRFAGSGDRAAIGTLVFDSLRRRKSIAARMEAETPRALVLGAARDALGITNDEVTAAADGSEYAISALSELEQALLNGEQATPSAAPDVIGDYPEWLGPSFERVFGARAGEEGAGLSRRAPIDLRVNGLKAEREKVLRALSRFNAVETPWSPIGVRIAAPAGGARAPNVEAENGHGKGWFEVQDEGSQLAGLLAGAGPREQVLDLCAGAGGKTLEMAAQMRNTGQIYAYDTSRQQLRPIFERLKRAGARNVQVMDAGDEAGLRALGPRFDVVLVDAPCTGTGTWRRRPDAKWRLKPQNIDERQGEQRKAIALGADMVKPGGHLIYVTCSVLPEENSDQVTWFCQEQHDYRVVPFAERWTKHVGGEVPVSADGRDDTLLLTPATHGTDGFFIAVLRRRSQG